MRNGNEAHTLTDAVLHAIGRNNRNFQNDLSDLLSEGEDHFIGQIAGVPLDKCLMSLVERNKTRP